ncbi:MAG: InlB B-repeat-containing protein [Fibromonadales bacterium]|nr:InlB B-repeat-containing protein [Fibromonadales bacterium]
MAKVEVIYYRTVTFNSNGGTAVSPKEILNGTRAAQPANPTRAGYRFDGWFSNPELTTAYNFNNNVTGNITIYAKWTPITNPTLPIVTFDPLLASDQITVRWNYQNPDNVTGKYHVYYRKDISGAWTFLQTKNAIETSGFTESINYTVAPADFGKTFQYMVAFTASTGSAPADPEAVIAADMRVILTQSTKVLLSDLNIVSTIIGHDDYIQVSFSGPISLKNHDTYAMLRSVNNGPFQELPAITLNSGSVNGERVTYVYNDNSSTNTCDGYRYQIKINAFNEVYTIEAGSGSITGNSKFTGLKASKGEHANQIRLQWDVEKQGEEMEIYRVFRRVVDENNVGTSWPEILPQPQEVITNNAQTVYWSDNNVLPGVFYEYRVGLYHKGCVVGQQPNEVDSKADIGFTQAFGAVSGRVTYGSGNSVQGVNMLVKRNDLNDGESQYRSLRSSGDINNAFGFSSGDVGGSNKWTLQFWVYPDAINSGEDIRIGSLGSVDLLMSAEAGEYRIHTSANTAITASSALIPANHWSHISIVRNGNNWTIHTVLDQNRTPDEYQFKASSFAGSAVTSGTFDFGKALRGNIDDVRFWSIVLDSAAIANNYSRRLVGNESGLRGYWTFDDALPSYAFDMSRIGTVYNGNHAVVNTLSFDKNVPNETYQLALKAITDANGNYQIAGIPYHGEGTSYSIVPSLGVHQFNPTEQLRYISQTSMVHNGTDFTDISAFIVSGKVVYDGGNYPVEGCTFEVDGIQVATNGQPVISGYDGRFEISVPIGVHKVQVKKPGHTFVGNGYITDENGKDINYNKNYNSFVLENTTRVKLIGHIVGSKLEHEKASGFGLRKNNIGSKELKLTASKQGYDLATVQKATEFMHNTGDKWANWKLPRNIGQDTTRMKVIENTVTINVSHKTGEYVAWVYPELYVIQNISAGNYGIIYDRLEELDLRNAPVIDEQLLQSSVYSWPDSIFMPKQGNRAEYWEYATYEDTVRYHKEWNFYHQEQPSFTIQQLVNGKVVNYFGDKEFEIGENAAVDLVTLVDGQVPAYLFDNKPVFRQGERYSFALSAFEEYYNSDTDVNDTVPVAGGEVSFAGEMLMETYPAAIELDSLGKGIFNFIGGIADLTSGIRNLSAMIRIDDFSYYSETFGLAGLSAYVLGGKSTGTDFITAAGDKIDFILHDPPGTNSYAYIEKGTAFTTTIEKKWVLGVKEQTETAAKIGVKTINLAGACALACALVGGEAGSENKVGLKQEFESKHVDNKTFVETTTFSARIETSSEPEFVGHNADIYVGRGTNTLYGLTNNITIDKAAEFGDPADVLLKVGDYAIGKQTSLALDMNFGTEFYYTGHEIENIMIPKWKDVLKNLFVFSENGINTATIKNPVYVSKLQADHPNFGTRNDDSTVWGSAASSSLENGPSYKMILPDTLKKKMQTGWKIVASPTKETLEITDSVMHLNQKINQWEKILADNEKRKANAISKNLYKPGDNISFGSGVVIEKGQSLETSVGKQTGWEQEWNVLIFTEVEFSIFGAGMEFKGEAGHAGEHSNLTTTDSLKSNAVGFVLSTNGDADQITVDYTLDTASSPSTYMFRTRGGRTSCPYETEVKTKYFEPGNHILNEGTMQIEVPKIAVSGGTYRLQVPATRAASFTLDITNESETNGTGWFKLTVDESTNPHGAVLKIDGMPIANGRYFSVPSGQVLKKTLTVEKGPSEDIYENIRLILASDCDPDLADEIRISAEFMPSCTDIAIKSPSDNWIMNTSTGDSVIVELENYDINFANFGYAELLYRSKSSSQWSSEMKFYSDVTRYNAAQGAKTLLGSEPTIKYWWHKDQKSDGEYEFAARTVCETSGNTFIADYTTPAVNGAMDMSMPRSLGLASPASGIFGIGDELSITFNEDIQTGMLTENNFSITGVLNAQEMAEPSAGIAFTGTQSAKTELPIYTGGSFSIETWFKHNVGNAGTLFSYGSASGNSISLGFDASGKAVLKIGEEAFTSTASIANDETWKYIAMAYNGESNSVSVYEFEGATDKVLFADKALNFAPPTQGLLTAGNNLAANSGFTGAISQLHFYSTKRTQADVSASKSLSKSGRELGLVGYWALDEAEGTIAVDKARARNLMLNNADWYVYPSGYAKQTGSNYFSVYTATYPLHAFSDFTLEFWFRSENASQRNQTLFSSDNGYIAINANGGLTLYKNDGTEIRTLASANIIDTKWHHIAMSVRRGGNVNVYVNGIATASFSETLLGTFASGYYYFGAKRTPPNTFSDYFAGSFDEIRIWNSALAKESIVLNKNSKLRGNEAGLLAYYPFETYTKQSNGLITVTQTTNNIVDNGSTKAEGATVSAVAASMKDARPVENVPFGYVASNNKIVFTIDPLYFSRVEGSILTIAVKDVRDMRDNKSNTEQWTAFVRRNALLWDSDPVSIVMEEGESRSFTARITNTGGATVSYSIENLPSWLNVVSGVGNLAPMASRDLTFTVAPGVNIGNYEASVGLASGNGISEALGVQLKISGKRPGWVVNPNEFDGSMSITGQIKINGVFSENTEDVLAAFIGDKCVGTASLTYISPSNAYFVFSNIHGNEEYNNQPVTFKLWEASTGRIYPKVETSVSDIRFASSSVLGTPLNPVVFNALDAYEQVIALRKGWNWISSSVLSDNPSILEQAKSSLGSAGVMIKGQESYIQRKTGWIGTLEGISEKSMYLVNVSSDVSLSLQGSNANPATQIGINKGWNWIGYIPQFSLPVKNALAGINAQPGDIIKGQSSYAVYLGAGGWAGTLDYMQAGKGYMYHSVSEQAQSLVYPSQASQANVQQFAMSAPPVQSHWTADPSAFSSSMTVTSVVVLDGEEVRSSQIEIGAFSGEECRGSTFLQYVPGEDKYIGFLVVYGEGSEKITLKAYDHEEGKEYAASNAAISFSANAIHGTPDFYIVEIGDPDNSPINNVPQIAQLNIRAYTIGNTIVLQNVPKDAKIEVYNLQGKRVHSRDAMHRVSTIGELQIPVPAKGMYIVKAGKQILRITVR